MTAIVPFEDTAIPAHIAQVMEGRNNLDLTSGVHASYPIVSYKGKVWHVNEGDNSTLVKQKDSDDPAASIEVVLLKANPNLSKIYYRDGYEEGSTTKPVCYSNNSIEPALDAQERQHDTCGGCPNNAWGSKITENGTKAKACADSRRMAIAPIGELDRPMLLRVPAASLKELMAYAETLNKRGAAYSAVNTKIGFDHTVAFPKLTFKALRWLTEDEMAAVLAIEEHTLGQITALDIPTQVAQIEGKPPVNAPKPETVAAKPAAKTTAAKKPAPVAAAQPEPVVPDALMAQADAALDEALAALDDE